jgi:nonsense-mediated mRNA decay protein 3
MFLSVLQNFLISFTRRMSVKCFKCGKNEAVIDGLCMDCYLESHELIKAPEYIDLMVCKHCGAISTDGKSWKDYEDFEKGITEEALKSVEISGEVKLIELDTELIERDPRNYEIRGRALLKIGDAGIEEMAFESKIRLKGSTCPRCSRINGGYYEAIIQVSGADNPLTEEEKADAEDFIASRVEEMGRQSRDIFITDEEEMHGGLDFYISNARAAKSIARELTERISGRMKESKKLAGRKEGEDIYRFTYLVRLPEFRKGDFVEYMGEYYQIISNTGSTWRLYSLENMNERKVRDRDAKSFKLIAKKEDVEEAVVVSYRDGEVQVLDPRTYRTVTLRYHKDPGKSLRVIRIEEEIYPLREDQ